jgi:hypothetical protein
MKTNEDFDRWYEREGVRFFSKDGHREYMKFAFNAGRVAEANASITRRRKLPEPFYAKINTTYNWR